MLKLKLQYFGHLMWSFDSFEKPWCWEDLGAGGEDDDRGWDGITNLMDMSLSELREFVTDREAWPAVIRAFAKSWMWLSDCTELTYDIFKLMMGLGDVTLS